MAPKEELRSALPGLIRTLRRFGPHVRRQRRLIGGGSAALLAEIVFRLVEPWPLKVIIDTVAAPVGSAVAAPDPGRILVLAAIGIVAATGLRAGASYLSTVAFALAGNRVLTDVRAELYAHLQRLSLAFHMSARSGDLVQRVTGDVGRLQEVTVTAALPLVGNLVTFVGMVAVMTWLDWRLTLIALLALPLFVSTSFRLSRRITVISRAQRNREGELASVATESLGAIEVVQAYSLEPTLERTFSSSNDQSLREGVRAKRLSAGLERKTDLIVAMATGLVLYVGARRVLSHQLTPGELVVFVTYLKSAFKPMRDMAKYTGRLAKASASGERIVDLLDTIPSVTNAPWARPAAPFRGDVRFEQVSVAYGDGPPAIAGLDLHLHPGQRVAVVGSSGAGKSTLMSLLLRLQDPTGGRVLIDGHDLRDLTLDSVRGQIAIVLQESVLFATTIRENIAYGADDVDGVTDDEIEAAARLANAHDFITRLPDGYETVLGERGASLSGGERQRIAVARAAVRQAPIVVLDEATAGLDGDNEREVLEALRRLTAGRTTFIISHDSAPVADADVVVRLERGRVVTVGLPEDGFGRDPSAGLETVARMDEEAGGAPC
ncbi:ABC transporter ATP-binding protein [soil metagenome]